MTAEEFRQRYEAYDWEPHHPLVVILKSGQRGYIDMPEQVTLAPDELIITRRANPHRPERYRYADIDRVVPLMELPADPGGMSYAEFDPLIRELLMADPFRPFVIELRTGERLEINRRADIGRACRHFTLFGNPPRSFTQYTYDQVTRVRPMFAPVAV
jgi:hypothetical protein